MKVFPQAAAGDDAPDPDAGRTPSDQDDASADPAPPTDSQAERGGVLLVGDSLAVGTAQPLKRLLPNA